MLLDAGASHVASLLVESRNYLDGLLEMPRVPISDAANPAVPPALAPPVAGTTEGDRRFTTAVQ